MNRKHTKRALCMSFVSLLLCCSMLVGSTFAWFTDTATTKVNSIQAGKLDVDLVDGTGATLVGKPALEFIKADNTTEVLWEPGCTYKLPEVFVKNNGDLWLKYQIVITGIKGDAKLNDAIVWTIDYGYNETDASGNQYGKLAPNGQSNPIKISGHMKEEAGNEYQGLSIDGIAITVNATQVDAEWDSSTNEYDKNAPTLVSINGKSYANLNAALDAATAGDTITVGGTVTYEMPDTSSSTVDFKGVTIAGNKDTAYPATIVFKNATGSNQGGCKNIITGVTLKDVSVVDETYYTTENGENSWEFTYLEMKDVTAENVIFTDGIILDGGNNFTKCTFMGHNNDSSNLGDTTMYAAWVNSGNSTFTGCSFVGTRGLKVHEAYGSEVASVTVDKCAFGPLSEKPGIALGTLNLATTVSITNSTFTNTQPGDQGNYMYETDTPVAGFTFTESNNFVQYVEGFAINNGVYEISAAEGLAYFAKTVNGTQNKSKALGVGKHDYKGETVKLTADIDMAGVDYVPAGNVNKYPSVTFAGTFDGQNHVISNLTTSAYGNDGYAAAGLFGSNLGTIKNVIVDKATITSSHYAGGIVGYSYGTVESCTVKNSTITSNVELMADGTYDNGDKVGGVVGYLSKQGATGIVNNCTVENVKINAYRDLGGAVGYADGATTVTNNKITNVILTIDKDPVHNYKNYTQDAEHDLGQIIGENHGTESGNTATNVTETEKYVIKTAKELKDILTMAGSAGAGNATVELTSDVVLSETWTPVNVDGYNGADVITLNGNGHTIKGLTAPLFAGGFAGGSGIVINDLTIADSTIVSTNTQGSGAFIETVDSMDTITLNDCHLLSSTVNGSRTGGLIGWTSGYDDETDGAVKTYVTVKNCSVIGCTIENTFSDEGNTPHTESLGAIFGHAGANPWTFTTIENCKVKNNTLIGGSGKTGVILGTANVGEVTITGCTMEGNTVNGTASTAVYGRTSFGTTGKLTIDGVAVN